MRYLKSLLSRINKFIFEFTDESVLEEIKTLKEIYKRNYINTDVELDGRLKNSYDDEADLINSWRGWYVHATSLLKKKKWYED